MIVADRSESGFDTSIFIIHMIFFASFDISGMVFAQVRAFFVVVGFHSVCASGLP